MKFIGDEKPDENNQTQLSWTGSSGGISSEELEIL
jgi:hypothetical protein